MDELKGTLSFPVILLITINSIMGTGIFFLPAIGASVSGPMSIISWVLLSLISIYISMCFGELASMFPKSGGIYEYCKQAYGFFPSFLVGWTALVVGNITIAMLVVGAVRYLNPALPSIAKIGISLFFILMFNYMAFSGMKTSSFMLVTFSFITLSSIFGLIIPGLLNFSTSNLTPFFTHPFSKVFVAIFFISETFFGWETATFLSEETKNPRKVIPKALIYGTIIIAVISILFVITSLATISWTQLGNMEAPLSNLAKIHYGIFGEKLFVMLVYLSIIGSVAGWIVSAPRLILALAKDKFFLSQCAKIHPKNKTPHMAILFQTILTSLLIVIGAGSYETLLEILLPLVLIIYSFTLISVTLLRIKKPYLKRGFKVPFGKIGPIIVVLILIILILYWISSTHGAFHTFRLALSFALTGIPIYLLLTFYYNPDAIRKITDKFAKVSYWTENINLPKKVRKEILNLLGDIKGKRILEHGCGVGTLTLELSEAVGNKGKIFATNISKGELEVLNTRVDKKGALNITTIHDEHHTSRIHPYVPKIDVFVSVGTLGYTQDINNIARQIYKRMPVGGKICVLEYIDLYKVLPNGGWLSDLEAIEDIFRDNGFLVRVVKRKGLLWNYLYVYGVKSKKSLIPYI
ncbi:MAG: amino acid permease [Nanobdellota archaeon]